MPGSGCEIVVALGAFLQSRLKSVLLPGKFFIRWLAMRRGSVSRSEGLCRSFWLIAHSLVSPQLCRQTRRSFLLLMLCERWNRGKHRQKGECARQLGTEKREVCAARNDVGTGY